MQLSPENRIITLEIHVSKYGEVDVPDVRREMRAGSSAWLGCQSSRGDPTISGKTAADRGIIGHVDFAYIHRWPERYLGSMFN